MRSPVRRWPGYTLPQVRARLRRTTREMEHDLRPQDLGAYSYLDSADQARAGLDLIRVLRCHDAYWNVACTGHTPPSWLHNTGDAPATAG